MPVAEDGRLVGSFEQRGPDKAGRYGWNKNLGRAGKHARIGKHDLRVDSSYQRNQSKHKALRIARELIWSAFGCLIVSRRSNGTLFVIDGGHRAMAAMHRTDIDKVPCLVFDGLSKKEEAAAFVAMNAHRKAPTGVELFAADVVAENPTALIANQILSNHGAKVGDERDDATVCRAPRAFLDVIRLNGKDHADDVLSLLDAAWPDHKDRLRAHVLKGCSKFIREYLKQTGLQSPNGIADKFSSAGLSALYRRSLDFRELTKRSSAECFAMAMAEFYNKNRRKGRIQISGMANE